MYEYIIEIRSLRAHQSLTGRFIYTLGRAPQRIDKSECTPMLCMALFQGATINCIV